MSEKKNKFLDPPHNIWSTFFYATGALTLIATLLVFLITDAEPNGPVIMVIFCVSLQFFFIGHLVQLLSDMRHFLRDLAKNIH